jgi:hypothetical protein
MRLSSQSESNWPRSHGPCIDPADEVLATIAPSDRAVH